MPSTSSHSSGGSFSHSSGGGGHYHGGGSSSYSYHSSPRRRTYIFFGPVVSGNRHSSVYNMLFVFMFISFVVSLLAGFLKLGTNTEYKTLKNDFEVYYRDVATIDVQDATVEGIDSYMIYENEPYYYIKYYIVLDDLPYEKDLDISLVGINFVAHFHSTATYTLAEAKEIQSKGTILVGFNGRESVQADYDYSTDKEYLYRMSKINSDSSACLVVFIIFVVLLVICVVAIIVINKKDSVEPAGNVKYSTDTKNKYCVYCGAQYSPGQTKCHNCGAKIFDTKE